MRLFRDRRQVWADIFFAGEYNPVIEGAEETL
jgi:hypothetical protein